MGTLKDHLGLTPKKIPNLTEDGEWHPALFHYTTFPGLQGICESESLHATNIHYLNDYSEFKHGLDLASEIISTRRTQDKTSNHSLIDALELQIKSIRNINIFVASFSAKNDVLSQWRGYSNGSGASIAFLFESIKEIGFKHAFFMAKCIYDNSQKKTFIDAAIEDSLQGSNPANLFINKLLLLAAAFKHHSFQEEEEWRLISLPKNSNVPEIGFRSKETLLIPFFKINLNIQKHTNPQGKKELGFRQIMIGPSSFPDLSHRSVNILLERNNIAWNSIVRSNIPYRSSFR